MEFVTHVMKFLKFLPKGPTSDGEGFREKDLVQLYTDPGGIRTLALDSIKQVGRVRRAKKPEAAKSREQDGAGD